MSPPTRRLFVLLVLLPISLSTKLYAGPGAAWVQHYAGALCYEIFWVFAAKTLLPRARIWTVAAGVFGITCLLELLQLSMHPVLQWVRSFFLGRALIGTSFDPWDFLYYGIGTGMGVWLHRRLVEPTRPQRMSA